MLGHKDFKSQHKVEVRIKKYWFVGLNWIEQGCLFVARYDLWLYESDAYEPIFCKLVKAPSAHIGNQNYPKLRLLEEIRHR